MKFNIGDKVKFMDQEGQGTITRIISPSTVGVTIDDFELPYSITDLIKVEAPASAAERLFYEGTSIYGDAGKDKPDERKKKPASGQPEEVRGYRQSDLQPDLPEILPSIETEEERDERITPLRRGFTGKNPQPEGIYIGLLPLDQQFMLRGPIELYVINYTPHTLLYSLATRGAEAFYGADFASVPPYSKILVESIGREDLGLWSEGVLQGFFYQDKTASWLLPFSKEYKLRNQQIGTAENYILPVFMRERTLLVPMCCLEEHQKEVLSMQSRIKGMQAEQETGKVSVPDAQNPLRPYMIDKNVAEVDLHVEKLLETRMELKNASPEDYLAKQLSVFETCLNQALSRRLSKIIFIHGVGNGILKHEIEKKLKNYESLHFMDASFLKYGRGAIEVWLDTSK